MAHVVPAIIPKSFDHLKETLETVRPFAREVQVDIVDGVFVPFTSWPYVGQGNIALLSRFTDDFDIEVDLMLMEPETVIDTYVRAGVRRVVVHLESVRDIEAVFAHHRAHAYVLGLSIQNDTLLETLIPLIQHVDYVQFMGIAHIGSQGQPFDERVLDRVRTFRDAFPDIEIRIDGSVNRETLPRLRDAGATSFVAGSSILGAEDPEASFRELEVLAGA